MDHSESHHRGVFEGLWRLGSLVARVPAWLLIALVCAYRWTLSPLVGRHCRFEPTCSVYFIESVRKYGALRGAFRGVKRICRCHPWNPGGYDPP
jgi:uncharacterized protein